VIEDSDNALGLGMMKMDDVKKYKERYHGCAPTTFALIADITGMDSSDVFKALVGLSGGVGLVGKSACGALIGAAAAISLAFDLDRDTLASNNDAEFRVHAAVRTVVEKFIDKYGGVTCNEVQLALHGKAFDLNSEERRGEFNLIEKRCSEAIRDTVEWTIDLLLQINLMHQQEGLDDTRTV